MVDPSSLEGGSSQGGLNRGSLTFDVTDLTTISTRLKILEERYTVLRKKTQTTDQNIIEVEKNQYQEFKLLNDDLLNLKIKIKEVTEKLELIGEEIQNFAQQRELTILKRYVDFWEPLDFVTRKEINDFLRKKFEKVENK